MGQDCPSVLLYMMHSNNNNKNNNSIILYIIIYIDTWLCSVIWVHAGALIHCKMTAGAVEGFS